MQKTRKRPKRHFEVSTPDQKEKKEIFDGIAELAERLKADGRFPPYRRQFKRSFIIIQLIKAGLERNKEKIVDNFFEEEID